MEKMNPTLMPDLKPYIEPSWRELLHNELGSEAFGQLCDFLKREREHHNIFPPAPLVFNAFARTPVQKVKVVLLGQDPYHGAGQAHGLSFSVRQGVRIPPSLRNMFKELQADLGIAPSASGDLSKWAEQGVLLLNATLTVREGQAGSHQRKGWETFTDAAIHHLSNARRDLVFLLWGRYAQQKERLIHRENGHLILTAAHPSPLSAHTGFFGCRHFSRTNTFLVSKGIGPIDWNLNTQ